MKLKKEYLRKKEFGGKPTIKIFSPYVTKFMNTLAMKCFLDLNR